MDIGGHRLHICDTGEGKPAVLLEVGAGDFSFDWALVQPEVASFTRVCSYDRAGSAWSQDGPRPRTLKQQVHELDLLLRAAQIPPPYVLVGHSLGGLLMRLFAAAHPELVVGMVLVDSPHENTRLGYRGRLVRVRECARGRPVPPVQTMASSPPRWPSADEVSEWRRTRAAMAQPSIRPPYTHLPAEVQRLRLWATSQMPPVTDDEDYFPEELQGLHEARKPYALGDLPLVVIASGRRSPPPPGIDADEWQRLHDEKLHERRDQAALSRNGRLIVDPNSGHHVHLEHPALVVQAIREVVEAVRQGAAGRGQPWC